jgi:hypothetical protein
MKESHRKAGKSNCAEFGLVHNARRALSPEASLPLT